MTKHFDLYLDGESTSFTPSTAWKRWAISARSSGLAATSRYREGAAKLLDLERKEGGWGNYVDTSFALLFLTERRSASR